MIVAAFLMLLLVFTLFELLGDILRNQVSPLTVGEYLLNVVPYFLYNTTPLSMLLAVLVTFGLLQRSNEITAIPILLSLVDIKGAIITIDAMGTQTAIAEKIIEEKGDYILALKGNQGRMHDAVIDYVHEQTKTDFQGIGARRYESWEKKHGRIERRTYIQMPAPKSLPGFANWKGLLSIGIAFLWSVRDGKETSEIRYFISSLPVKVKQFAHAVRSHWGIENTCHWCLDVTYREDESRIRDVHLRENFAWLNRLTLSLLKQHPDKDSVAMKRRACGWNDEYMLEVLTGTKS